MSLNPSQFSQPHLHDPGPEGAGMRVMHWSRNREWDATREGNVHVGTGRAAIDRARNEQIGRSGALHTFTVQGEMLNTPSTPVTDNLANVISEPKGALWARGRFSAEHPGDEADAMARDFTADMRDLAGGRGVFYTNEVEDPGSLSAALPNQSLKHEASFPDIAPRKYTVMDDFGAEMHARNHTGKATALKGEQTQLDLG